jgi:hypothetical protein
MCIRLSACLGPSCQFATCCQSEDEYLVVGQTKTASGTGRTIPLNRTAVAAVKEYSEWYRGKFGELNTDWFVFPFGNPQPTDPMKPCTSFKTVWSKIRAAAGVKGRWHDNRHTLITELGGERRGGSDDSGHRRARVTANAKTLQPHPHGRETQDAKRKALESIVVATDRMSLADRIYDARYGTISVENCNCLTSVASGLHGLRMTDNDTLMLSQRRDGAGTVRTLRFAFYSPILI